MMSRPKQIIVNDKIQTDYQYMITSPMGRQFHPEFKPDLTPENMLRMGVFGGKYMTDCQNEFPDEWFTRAKLSPSKTNPQLNCFGVTASQSLSIWQQKGWIYHEDPRGWFQWYCRYYMGRRCEDDLRQIKRWKAIKRHIGQIKKNCISGDLMCRPKQRQALLHWAYDARKF